MLRAALLLCASAGILPAADRDVVPEASFELTPAPAFVPARAAIEYGGALSPRETGKTLWKASIGALVAAHALDVHSSWGKRELNTNLSDASGRFSGRGALLKLGLQGGLLAVEGLVLRRARGGRPYRILAVVNFVSAAFVSGVAARNYAVRAPASRAYQPAGLPRFCSSSHFCNGAK